MSLVSGLLNQTITTISSVVKDRYGDDTVTVEYSNVKCRFTISTKVVKDKNNEDVQTDAEVWLLPSYSNILRDWNVVYDSVTYKVEVVEKHYNLGGQLDHIKLYLV